MYCPVCRDEYRPGFTRCATCDVDLVESLTEEASGAASAPGVATEVAVDEGMVPFCGFLRLEEARAARDAVRASGRRAEILICEPPAAKLDAPIVEEFWLRVAPREFRAVQDLIGFEPAVTPAEDEESFQCSACGATVRSSDTKCPGCGLGFEE